MGIRKPCLCAECKYFKFYPFQLKSECTKGHFAFPEQEKCGDFKYKFEQVEVDIEEDIKELPELTSHINYEWTSVEFNRHKINELVRAVNKMRKNT